MSSRPPSIAPWLFTAILMVITVVWLLSCVARMANPQRYPIPAEVHYLMAGVLSIVGGGLAALPRRRDQQVPPLPPVPPVDKIPPDEAETAK